MSYAIEIKDKPVNCANCKFSSTEMLDMMENGEMLLSYYCTPLEKHVNPLTVDSDWPIVDLNKNNDKRLYSFSMFLTEDEYVLFYNFLNDNKIACLKE